MLSDLLLFLCLHLYEGLDWLGFSQFGQIRVVVFGLVLAQFVFLDVHWVVRLVDTFKVPGPHLSLSSWLVFKVVNHVKSKSFPYQFDRIVLEP